MRFGSDSARTWRQTLRSRDEMHVLVLAKAHRMRRRRTLFRVGAGSLAVLTIVGSVLVVSQLRARTRQPEAVATLPAEETTTTTPAERVPPQLLTPALYPAYLPAGDLPARLVIDTRSVSVAEGHPGHVQSYYGDERTDGTLAQLLIEDTQVGIGGDSGPATLAGHDVTLWHIAGDEVLGVTTTIDGAPVTLIALQLSTDELGVVLSGLHRNSSGRGWSTDSLPAGLSLVATGASGDVTGTRS